MRLWREPLSCSPSPAAALRALAGRSRPFALTGGWAGSRAILGCEPVLVADAAADPFELLEMLPAVQGGGDRVGGGWFGWLGYRLGARVELLPPGPKRPIPLPDFQLAYYDHVLRLDQGGTWWFEALASPGRERALRATRRELEELLSRAERGAGRGSAADGRGPAPLRLSNDAVAAHLDAVRECRERIAAGEIFQANICTRLESRFGGSACELLARALAHSPPALGGAFDTPYGGIASLSPELFLRREGRIVRTAPIKGTAVRDPDPRRAAAALAALQASAKDAAEHVMIVDLMRNDLGRVCAYGTVTAAPRPTTEAHPRLWHLVSEVSGRLRPAVGDGGLLRATFPPGSVTGAPKVQAMKVIARLERTGREVYTGAIGFASPIAGLQLNVAIRTLELAGGHLWLGAGGGIVADSDPQLELEEVIAKASPVADAVGTRVEVELPGRTGRTRRRSAAPLIRDARATGDQLGEAQPAPGAADPFAAGRAARRPARRPAGRPDPAAGVFETLLAREGRVQALDRHLRRLACAAAQLYGKRPPTGLRPQVLAQAAPLRRPHRLRVAFAPGARATITHEPLRAIGGSAAGAAGTEPPALTLVPFAVPGGLGPHKLVDRSLLSALPTRSEAGEVALLLDPPDELLEAAWANLWLVEDGVLVTPPADGRLLPGVMRELLLAHAPRLGLRALQEPVTLARAAQADAIFLTSSLRHAVPASLRVDAQDGARESSACARALIERVRLALAAADWSPAR